VPRQVPQRIVEHLEHTTRVALPTPGHVGGDVGKTFNPLWKEREPITIYGHKGVKTNLPMRMNAPGEGI
jgi:hypothetical protein